MSQQKPLARLADPSHTLYLIDISSFIFRAFFAIRSLKNKSGEPTNAVYGVATMLARLAEEAHPEYVAVCYDSKEPSFRKEIYPEYKANRSAPPEDLVPQFARIEQLVRALEMHSYRQPGVEADDLIASLARKWCKADPKNRAVIVSNDKDLMQLVDDRICVWDTMGSKIYTQMEVEEKFGVKPTQVRDYLALVGDSSDNIPGVPGVGPKTAAELLKEHGTLDGVLKAAAAGKISGKKGQTIHENEEKARLSAELATVHEELQVAIPLEALKYHFHVTPECVDLLRDLDFHTLVTRWAGEGKGPSIVDAPAGPAATRGTPSVGEAAVHAIEGTTPVESGSGLAADAFRTINTEAEFQKLLKVLARSPEFGFDVETTSLNVRQAELVGVAICHDPAFAYYIPVGHRGTSVEQLPAARVLEGLKPLLEDPRHKKIGQNLKYDWSVLAEMGIQADGIGADTMVAAYVLDPEGRHNLETLASHYLNYRVTTYEEVCGKGKDQLCFDQVAIDVATRYSAEDALIAVRLWAKLKERLQAEGLMRVFAEVDLPLVPILSRLERRGVCIDVQWLKKLGDEFSRQLRDIEQKIAGYTNGPINLNSPKQLGHLLFEELRLPVQGKTKTGYSTDAKVLDSLSQLHEVPKLLLEYREISKLKGTYVDPLPQLRDPKDGRIHATFHQTVAATGRLSGSDPNLQNIPIRTERGQKIRRAFVPSEGRLLLSADYSQIELRLLAHMSADPELMGSFKRDEDVHRRTAAEIFGVAPEQVNDRQRGIAKAINFGLMYGKTPFGLAQELKIPQREAKEIINRYFERYRGVKAFLDNLVLEAREKGWATTLLGRKRHLPDIRSSNPAVRGNAERMAMNTPIQGTAADMMKIAMIRIDEALREGRYESAMIIQVHDEVVLDIVKDEATEVQKLVVGCMESAMELNVPLRVNAALGENWMEL